MSERGKLLRAYDDVEMLTFAKPTTISDIETATRYRHSRKILGEAVEMLVEEGLLKRLYSTNSKRAIRLYIRKEEP